MTKSIIRILTISIALMSVTPAFAQGRKLAVVVGINAYRASSGLPTLQHAANDAAALSNTLRETGFTVSEMTLDVARQEGQESMAPQLAYIRDQIKGVLETPNLGENDAVLITLHGHGVQFDLIDDQGQKTPKFFFCAADATVDGIKTVNDIKDRNNLLPLEELYADLEACSATTKLLIVDACRNDPTSPHIFREALASSTLPKLPPPTGGTAAFFSCKANQRAVEDTGLKHGVFTHFLVKGLKGEADLPLADKPADGVVTFAELSTYVANNTHAHVFGKFKVSQSPELRGDYDLNLPVARFYTAPDAPTQWTERQIDQQLLSAVKTRFEYELKEIQRSDDEEKTLALIDVLYDYYRDISIFGLSADLDATRETILEQLESVRGVLQNASESRDIRVMMVNSDLKEWLQWDQFSDEVRKKIATLNKDMSAIEVPDTSFRLNVLRTLKSKAVVSLQSSFPESACESLVLRAIRDRYWKLEMNSAIPEERRSRLQLSTLLQCTSLKEESISNIPRGRPIVVQFSGFSWCGPCRETLKGWKAVQEEFGERFTLVFVSVDGEQQKAKELVAESGVKAIWCELGDLNSNESVVPVPSYPTVFNCDSSGNVIAPTSSSSEEQLRPPFSDDEQQKFQDFLRKSILESEQ